MAAGKEGDWVGCLIYVGWDKRRGGRTGDGLERRDGGGMDGDI